MKKIFAIAGAAATAFTVATTTTAEAATISLGGKDYDISTITGTYTDNQALLEEQPWFTGVGTTTLGFDAAMQVGSSLPFLNLGGIAGPFFAESFDGNIVNGSFAFAFGGFEGPNTLIAGANEEAVWAVATEQSSAPVPEPTTILGSLVALGIGSRMKRKVSPTR